MTGATQNQKPLRRAAYRLAAWQAALTFAVAAVAAAVGGVGAAKSALMGGGINIIAGLYQALRMYSGQAALQPERFMRAVYASEAIKIALTVALFIVVIRVMRPQFAPLIIAYAATFLVYLAALGTGYPWLQNEFGKAKLPGPVTGRDSPVEELKPGDDQNSGRR
jgi:ATP synthase protein I